MRIKILTQIFYLILKLFNLTYRYRYVNPNKLDEISQASAINNYIIGLWHQNLFAIVASQMKIPYATMASDSKDGEIITLVFEQIGFTVTRGSATRGGIKGLKGLVRCVRNRHPGALTVDGPTGPAHIVKKGIFELSKMSKTPAVPFVALADRYWTLEKTWDQFRLPKPFSRIGVWVGEPFEVQRKTTNEDYNKLCLDFKSELERGEVVIREFLKNAN